MLRRSNVVRGPRVGREYSFFHGLLLVRRARGGFEDEAYVQRSVVHIYGELIAGIIVRAWDFLYVLRRQLKGAGASFIPAVRASRGIVGFTFCGLVLQRVPISRRLGYFQGLLRVRVYLGLQVVDNRVGVWSGYEAGTIPVQAGISTGNCAIFPFWCVIWCSRLFLDSVLRVSYRFIGFLTSVCSVFGKLICSGYGL